MVYQIKLTILRIFYKKNACWTWNQRLMRGPDSILTGGNIMSLDFFLVMPILALLPMLCVYENPDFSTSQKKEPSQKVNVF